MNKLVLIRHGESVWNAKNLFTGWTDVELSDKGKQEAKDAGRKLLDLGIVADVVLTSELKRAHQTVEEVLEVTKWESVTVLKTWRLNERHYGDLQGLNKTETAEKYGDEQVHKWRRSFDVAPPGGESLKDTMNRALPVFYNVVVPLLKNGVNVVIIAHGNSNRSLIKVIENISDAEIPKFELATGIPIAYAVEFAQNELGLKFNKIME